ncbi:MAG: PilZ domain-containing protein [Gammaproteobacteria bacterium]|nr:PilZ domain-containing protein [Gammaproteobacteria bacterium]
MSDHSDRRKDQRFVAPEDLSLQIVFSSEHPGLLGKTIDSSAIDISASGLKILFSHMLKKDSVLDMWITLKNENRKFFLTGNVRWCTELSGEDVFEAGVILRDRRDTVTDLVEWRKLVKSLLVAA